MTGISIAASSIQSPDCKVCFEDSFKTTDKLHSICVSACAQNLLCSPCAKRVTEFKDAKCPFCKDKIKLENLSDELKADFNPLSKSQPKPQPRVQARPTAWAGVSGSHIGRIAMR